MTDSTFVSRRDNHFKRFPPATAQLAVIVPFFGDLSVWVRTPGELGWHFPTSTRRSGETILGVAKRELWDSARIVAPRLDLLGAIRLEEPENSTAYVYMCETSHLPWSYELPEGVEEIGVFRAAPARLASQWSGLILEAALRAKRTGLR